MRAVTKHTAQLEDYATTCLNAHITGLVLKRRSGAEFCRGLDGYLKFILMDSSVEDLAALMNSRAFRDAIIEACESKGVTLLKTF